jgi:hypothetical protein
MTIETKYEIKWWLKSHVFGLEILAALFIFAAIAALGV